MKQDRIVILDLGSTENTTIARAIRALGVYSEIYPHDISAAELTALPGVKGVIVNGGPNHVVEGREIFVADEVYACGLPVLAVDHPAAKTERQLAAWPEEDKLSDALRPFVFDVCGAQANWNMKNFIADQVELIRRQVGDKKVLLALSGGVDSLGGGGAAAQGHRQSAHLRARQPRPAAQGRAGAGGRGVPATSWSANLIYVDAVDRFLDKLAGVADPEQKRKIIGAEFIRVFEEEARKLEGIEFLAPGHHLSRHHRERHQDRQGGQEPTTTSAACPRICSSSWWSRCSSCSRTRCAPAAWRWACPTAMVYRQPFPGPGLGVRCLGAITRDRLEAVRESDAILREEFAKAGLDRQGLAVFHHRARFQVRGRARTMPAALNGR